MIKKLVCINPIEGSGVHMVLNYDRFRMTLTVYMYGSIIKRIKMDALWPHTLKATETF